MVADATWAASIAPMPTVAAAERRGRAALHTLSGIGLGPRSGWMAGWVYGPLVSDGMFVA